MRGIRELAGLAVGLLIFSPATADSYTFGVLPQRGAVLTAQYWNPILDYVKRTRGVELVLKLARTGAESREAAGRGEYDFVYSNHIFEPQVAVVGYKVILRPRDEAIRGQIVTLDESPVRALRDLAGRPVAFPSPAAFVGYAVPADALLREGIAVIPLFGGTQEGIMAQLKTGRVMAAGVNSQLMEAYAQRERLHYRVLWESPAYLNLPIAVHPRVPRAVAQAVKEAIDGMDGDPQGLAVLSRSAAAVGQKRPYGFRASSQDDYRSYIEFYERQASGEGH